MKLIVIGNGMDIHHGLKTKWNEILDCDFKEELINLSDKIKMLSNCGDWTDFENDIKSMVVAHFAIFWGEEYICRYLKNSLNKWWRKQFRMYRYEMRDHAKDFYLENKKSLEGNDKTIRGVFKEKFDSFPIDFKDYSAKIINKISREIQKEVKRIIEKGLSKKEKIVGVFEKNDFVVINYNYTKIYEGEYFKPEDVVYIHNSIELTDNFDSDDEILKEDSIMVGNYMSNFGNDEFHKDKWDVSGFKKPSCFSLPNKKWREFLHEFRIESGYKKINFIKDPKKTGANKLINKWSEIKEKINSKNKEINEIVFLDHSVNDNDIKELKNELPLEEIDKITSYNYFSIKKERNQIEKHRNQIEEHRKQIKKHWPNKNIKIYIKCMS